MTTVKNPPCPLLLHPHSVRGVLVPPTRDDTNGFAIAAFVLSLIGGGLLSVIFAFVALSKIKQTRQRGRGMAIAALVINGVYPGDEEILAAVQAKCIEQFERFVGRPYTESALDFYYMHPTQASWAEGDRIVVCAVYDPSGPLTGTTMKGSQR